MSQLAILNPATGAQIDAVPADDAVSVAAKALRARAAQPAWAARRWSSGAPASNASARRSSRSSSRWPRP